MIFISIALLMIGAVLILFSIITCRGSDYTIKCIKCPLIWIQILGAFIAVMGILLL